MIRMPAGCSGTAVLELDTAGIGELAEGKPGKTVAGDAVVAGRVEAVADVVAAADVVVADVVVALADTAVAWIGTGGSSAAEDGKAVAVVAVAAVGSGCSDSEDSGSEWGGVASESGSDGSGGSEPVAVRNADNSGSWPDYSCRSLWWACPVGLTPGLVDCTGDHLALRGVCWRCGESGLVGR